MQAIDWKILYTNYKGPEKRAVEFLYREMGGWLLRMPGIYAIHTMACEHAETTAGATTNLLVIGRLQESAIFRRFIQPSEVPADGYCIRVLDNPDVPSKQLVLIAGDTPQAVLYGAIDFIDIAVPEMTPELGNGLRFPNRTLQEKLPSYGRASAPQTATRSVFCWGHTVNNYREYIENMARMKLNEVMLWNEFPPLNAQEVVEYAHSWGLRIVWGFAWGWSTGQCQDITGEKLAGLSDRIVEQWRNVWRPLGGDGIYFQSFTETRQETTNGVPIAEAAVSLVNETAEKIWREAPGLRLIFGLHATSVRNKLEIIAKTHPDICILWEDCGGFPYLGHAMPAPDTDLAFTEALLNQNRRMGLVFKGQMMMEWGRFVHPVGSYVLGNASGLTSAHDAAITEPAWHHLKALWTQHGEEAYRIAQMAHASPNCEILNLTGNLNGRVQWPTALVAQLLWGTSEAYQELLARVFKLPYLQ
ncbi:MAG: hypothetical protein J5654_09110 [Victivallales bacterium]|nr:hypothetical protein [Victivallales bacterium]